MIKIVYAVVLGLIIFIGATLLGALTAPQGASTRPMAPQTERPLQRGAQDAPTS